MKFFLLLSLTFLLTAHCCNTGPRFDKGRVEDALRLWFEYTDRNGDGKVSQSEAANVDFKESPHIHTILCFLAVSFSITQMI